MNPNISLRFLATLALLVACGKNAGDGEATEPELTVDTMVVDKTDASGASEPDGQPLADDSEERVEDGGWEFERTPGFGTSCEENADCETGWCVDGPAGSVCTQTCLEECPDGWLCKGVTNTGGDITFICVPQQVPICEPCIEDDECGDEDDRCIVIPEEGAFCSRECDPLNPCPDGFVCQASEDGSAPQCFPTTGSCICGHDILGEKQPCKLANETGTCWGFRVCIGAGGWGPCDAQSPDTEVCNGIDDDCNGLLDEGTGGAACDAESEFGSCPGKLECHAELGLVCNALPPTEEICDGVDNDCDGQTDENEGDLDGDGIPDCSDDDLDGDGDPNTSDCDAWDPTRHAGAPEQCNGVDDDCDGEVPVGEVDTDGDGMTPCAGDCDDTSTETFLGAEELCDGEDNDCDGAVPAEEADEDEDGALACADDCDDTTSDVGPDAEELCGGVDEDCDGEVDEEGALDCQSHYVDLDGDGAGAGDPKCLCGPNQKWSTTIPGDCNDDTEKMSPLNGEICDGFDNDCDVVVDEPGADGCQVFLVDNDGDGWGATGDDACLCEDPGDFGDLQPGDCDDENDAIHPGQPEGCDGLDSNCDTLLPDDEADLDGDGFMACEGDCQDDTSSIFPGQEEFCDGLDSDCDGELPAGEHDDDKDGWPVCAGDCDDWSDSVWPGATEICGGKDENCDGETDEPGAQGCTTWYPDEDGDGFGPSDLGQCVCGAIDGLSVTQGSDCDDDDPLEHPWSNAPCANDADCCQVLQSCAFGFCVDGPTPCGDDDDCWADTYCQDNGCIPFGIGPGEESKPSCEKVNEAGLFLPTLQCEWAGAPEGDPFPNHQNVLGTPLVADFDLNDDPTLVRPSIVFVSYFGEDGGFSAASSKGIVRVLDGETCAQLYTLGDQTVVGASPLVVIDLDLAADDRPEIVGFREGGGLVAFKYDPIADDFVIHWIATEGGATSTLAANTGRWNGPSAWDLDGDGFPEVMMGSAVFDHEGKQISNNLGYQKYSAGLFDVVADLDLDGKAEYADGAFVYEWTGSGWAKEPYATVSNGWGHVAVADFGDYPVAGLPDDIPELGVIRNGHASIQDLSGKVVFGPFQLPSWPPGTGIGTGGPPTVGDFDGDGVPELAAAGRGAYSIFDQGCAATPLPLGCTLPGVLWFRWSQDYSSSMTGSSIYDFEADGVAEAVYADECFTRIYDGLTGDVIFSQWRSSCTWYENPVIADTDGDLKAELVTGSNTNCGISCPTLDPVFRGLTCQADSDCPNAGGWCDVGRCRCTTDEHCGPPESSYVCADPLPNTPGTGQVCRAQHGGEIPGIRVYRDVADNWVVARPIWSQHAYQPNYVDDQGKALPMPTVEPHWLDKGTNHYRQNAQGKFDPVLAPDLTADPGLIENCDEEGVVHIPVEICNRGALPVAQGVTIGVFDGDPLGIGEVICLLDTTQMLHPAQCETLVCDWTLPDDEPHDVFAFADFGGPKGGNQECLEGNNQAIWPGVTCISW